MASEPRRLTVEIVGCGEGSRGAAQQPMTRPQVLVGNRSLADCTTDALIALQLANEPPSLFIRGGHIVRIFRDEHGVATVQNLDDVMMRGHLALSADFNRKARGKDGSPVLVPISPPIELAQNIVSAT